MFREISYNLEDVIGLNDNNNMSNLRISRGIASVVVVDTASLVVVGMTSKRV